MRFLGKVSEGSLSLPEYGKQQFDINKKCTKLQSYRHDTIYC